MIDRKKAFWAWVWNGSNDHRVKRFVVDSIDGKNCIAVSSGTEQSYFNGDHVSFLGWEHYERIPEPKKKLRGWENYERIPEPKKRLRTRDEVEKIMSRVVDEIFTDEEVSNDR